MTENMLIENSNNMNNVIIAILYLFLSITFIPYQLNISGWIDFATNSKASIILGPGLEVIFASKK